MDVHVEEMAERRMEMEVHVGGGTRKWQIGSADAVPVDVEEVTVRYFKGTEMYEQEDR